MSLMAKVGFATKLLSNRNYLNEVHLLNENFTPYDATVKELFDEELQWCLVKNGHLKQDPKFNQMYELDKDNRTTLLQTLKEKIASLQKPEKEAQLLPPEITTEENKTILFVDMLTPVNNSSEETLQFITSKLAEAGFDLNIFSTIAKLPNRKNPYGLNGAIAAMIDFFYQHNYFTKEYNLEEIFKAYSAFTNNSIAKLKTFLSDFRKDNSYIKHFDKLKQLKIDKMK